MTSNFEGVATYIDGGTGQRQGPMRKAVACLICSLACVIIGDLVTGSAISDARSLITMLDPRSPGCIPRLLGWEYPALPLRR